MPKSKESKASRLKRYKKAAIARKNEEAAFAQLMNLLGYSDHRHKACPPRTDILKITAERIRTLREQISTMSNIV